MWAAGLEVNEAKVDDLVEFVNICSFFLVIELFISTQFLTTVLPNFFHFFRQN